ncbi:hypothetical protein L210DRAFT_3535928 [Boletus edulis BED1]|uniref:Uncharacterized protein n=1 Tax=Boletus edulis BED1 TaxID=1328754 RepID=A0AAD4BWX2_BOLED|nr:hypothetical protein L210DRAFT_3535928 [Boletus edulis BED1]
MSSLTTLSTPNSPYSSYFRRRTIGRAASPPTWACYEQIPYSDDDDDDDDYSDSQSEDDSCSEDGENYHPPHDHSLDHPAPVTPSDSQDDTHVQNMEIDKADHHTDTPSSTVVDEKNPAQFKKDIKGKQRAVDPEAEAPKRNHRKRDRRPTHTLRPILTIQKSQGFVWNQDLFVPPYIKDRYVASTSPPGSKSFISNSWSSTTSSMTDFEVEVVEIRIRDGELYDIIP